eukprot:11532581-Alexandrium_andersonii.AAC.1
MLSSSGSIVTLGGILHRALNHDVPLDDVVQAGLLLRDPDLLRARAADAHDEQSRSRDRAATLAAGKRALFAEPLP